jgi:hypothetical protein
MTNLGREVWSVKMLSSLQEIVLRALVNIGAADNVPILIRFA